MNNNNSSYSPLTLDDLFIKRKSNKPKYKKYHHRNNYHRHRNRNQHMKPISKIPNATGTYGRGLGRNYRYIHNDSSITTSTYTSPIQTKHQKMKSNVIEESLPANEIRIESNGCVSQYVAYISSLINSNKQKKQYDSVRLIAHSRNIPKLVDCVETLKREIMGLHQLTELKHIDLKPQLKISLSLKKGVFDTSVIGYQAPIKVVNVSDVQKYVHDISTENAVLKNKLEILQKEFDELQKQSFETLNEIRSETTVSESGNNYNEDNEYKEWDGKATAEFIVGLNKERYRKYYDIMVQILEFEGIDGTCLNEINKSDLLRLGIESFKDRRDIYNSIQQLVSPFTTINVLSNAN